MIRTCFLSLRRCIPGGAGGLALMLLAGGAVAQQGGGVEATLGVSTSLVHEAPSDGETTTRAVTGLTLGLESVTSRQRVTLNLGGQVFADSEEVSLANRSAVLAYVYALRRQELGLTLSYDREEITAGTVIDDVILDAQGNVTGLSLIADEGRRESLEARAFLLTGRGGPLGTETVLRYRATTFDGLVSADFDDSTTVDLRSSLRVTLSPLLTVSANLRFTDTQEEDTLNTRGTTTQAGLGAGVQLDRLWRANAAFDWTRVDTETDVPGGRATATEDGLGLTASLTRAFRTGDLQLAYGREITAVGARDQLTLSRNFDLANGGALRLSGGAQAFDGADVLPRIEVSYAQPTPDGELSLRLAQTALVVEDDNALRSVLSAGYRHAVSERISLSFDAAYTAQSRIGDTTTGDQQSLSLGLGASYALNADWALSARLGRQQIAEVGADDRSITSVSLGASRSFSVRP